MKSRRTTQQTRLNAAIDRLADCVEHGHLLSTMGGEDLLNAAADEIVNLRARLRREESEMKLARLKIENSIVFDGLVSIRDLTGSSSGVRSVLTQAGFIDGDYVAVIDEQSFELLMSIMKHAGDEP